MKTNQFLEGEPIPKSPIGGVMIKELPQERELRDTPLPSDFMPGCQSDGKSTLDIDFPIE